MGTALFWKAVFGVSTTQILMWTPVIVPLGEAFTKMSKVPVSSNCRNLLQPFIFQSLDYTLRHSNAAVLSDCAISNFHIIGVEEFPKSNTCKYLPLVRNKMFRLPGFNERRFKCIDRKSSTGSLKWGYCYDFAGEMVDGNENVDLTLLFNFREK